MKIFQLTHLNLLLNLVETLQEMSQSNIFNSRFYFKSTFTTEDSKKISNKIKK